MRGVKHSWCVLSAVGLLVLAGCATPVKIDYKAGTDFAGYRTFALLPFPKQGPPEDPGLVLRLAQPAAEAVRSTLAAKGLSEAPGDRADLEVNLRGQSLPRVEIKDYGFTYPVMTRYGTVTIVENPYRTVSTYNERTLIIELFDRHSKELVWVGWTQKKSSRPVSPEALQEAIRKILSNFPPSLPSP